MYKRRKRGHQGRRRQADVCCEVIWVKADGSRNKCSWHCCALPEHLLLKSNFNLFWYKWNLCVEQHGKWGKLRYVYSCSVCQSRSIQGEKVPCQKMREFSFFLEFLYFPEACLLVILWKGSIELNDSRVTSFTEVWQMPYLLVLLYSWQATHMHACIDTYIHTHTHLTADKQTHMHAYTHMGRGDDWFFTSQKARKLACFAWILFVVSLQLNHVSRWILLKITLHQNMSILGLSWCLA